MVDLSEVARYAINGVVATLVHWGVLTFNIEIMAFNSAGVANFVAAIAGITVSFFGSRYFVYREHTNAFLDQVLRFVVLYLLIALLHGGILWGWTDIYSMDYRTGFLLALLVQVMLSYSGNKWLVFKK